MKSTHALLPDPRSYFGTSVFFCAISSFPFGILWSVTITLMEQRPFDEIIPLGLIAGLLFGVFFGFTMGYFFQGMTARFEVSDKIQFVSNLNVSMAQLAYNPGTRSEDFLTYRPSFQAGLAAGWISIQLLEHQAVIVGPKIYVKKLLLRIATK